MILPIPKRTLCLIPGWLSCFVLLFLSIWIDLAMSRPLVRLIRSTQEFDRLLQKHASQTGLPVIVDFYSESCGPCRMMAPVFYSLAKEFSQSHSAVFAKVNVNSHTTHELSDRYAIRSMPTFLFFWNGKKLQAFSGADEGQLRRYTIESVRRSEHENVMLTREALWDYYEKMEEEKSREKVDGVYNKCADMNKLYNDERLCVGVATNKFVDKLRKKYGKGPDLVLRFTKEDRAPAAEKKEQYTTSDDESKSKNKNQADRANLHLATKKELLVELEKRLVHKGEEAEPEDANDDWANMGPLERSWSKGYFPERVTIIGGGPAGVSAAIYAARAGLSPVVVAPLLGGQLQGKGVDVENYPGLAQAITGPSVVAAMRSQATQFGASFAADTVVKIDASVRPFRVYTKSDRVIDTHAIIVATGAESRWLHVPGEYEYRGRGVSACATCDGALYCDLDVIVVGGGDAAMEEAMTLARTSKSVTLVHRRSEFRASKVLAQRVIGHPSIRIVWNSVLTEILGNGSDSVGDSASESSKHVTGVRLQHVETLQSVMVNCSAVFVAIGHMPTTSFLKGLVKFDEPDWLGYVHTMGRSTRTSVPGIFAAGDVSDAIYRQAVTSAGSGAAAALDTERWLVVEGLGNEAEELEAELLRELLEVRNETSGEHRDVERKYNVYEDIGRRITSVRKKTHLGMEL